MQTSPMQTLRDEFLSAQLSGQRREALRLITAFGIERGVDASVLVRDVIASSQAEIGRLWETNAISVADEHVATAIAQVALAYVYNNARPGKPKHRKVLVACVEGEEHEFPARLLADTLDLSGYEVFFAGGNVPSDSLVQLCGEKRPDLVALSITLGHHTPALVRIVQQLRQAFPSMAIVVGGNACEACAELEPYNVKVSRGDAIAGLKFIEQELQGL